LIYNSELMVDAQYSTSGGRCLWIHCPTEGRRQLVSSRPGLLRSRKIAFGPRVIEYT